jgi:hypothetical protein
MQLKRRGADQQQQWHLSGRPPAAAAAAAAHLPAAIPQVLLPVGEAPDAVFQRYASLIVRHRQVELTNVRSFYKEAQKSPFKFFPWKTGNMHFKFLPVRLLLGCLAVWLAV